MKTYLVIIWLSAFPAIWSGGYMEVEDMEYCKKLSAKISNDPYSKHINQIFFCTQHIEISENNK